MIDVEKTIISQYANSPTIVALVNGMNAWIDPRADIDNFYKTVWNVDTANGYGLDIWGRIVGVSRFIQLDSDLDVFGFDNTSNDWQPLSQAPFFSGSITGERSYKLLDDSYRTLILVKAMSNISDGSAPAINQILQNLFAGRGRCYVSDTGNMTMQYTFEFFLSEVDMAILSKSGVLIRPAGVLCNLFNIDGSVFGFAEDDEPFNQAPFIQKVNTYAIQ